jgi:hypothetical protein
MALNVLLLESEPHGADDAGDELTEAGHTVLTCHDAGQPAFPCRGILDRDACPLRAKVIDVALAVRPRVRSLPAPSEDGVRCALMANVPLVVAGPSALDPYDRFATRVLDRTYQVVDACEAAAAEELPAHVYRAKNVLASSLGAGKASGADVSVTRQSGGLRVLVSDLDDVTRLERNAAVVRIVGALRAFDRSARTIDVNWSC